MFIIPGVESFTINPNYPGRSQNDQSQNTGSKALVLYGQNIKRSYDYIPDLLVGQGPEIVTTWSVAKHIHHAPDFRLDPKDYGMTQKDLGNIAEIGLINYINQGGTRPSEKYVQNLQMVWKIFTEDERNAIFRNRYRFYPF